MGKLKKFFCCGGCRALERGEVYEVSRAADVADSPVRHYPNDKGQVLSVCKASALCEGQIHSLVEQNDFNPLFCSTKVADEKFSPQIQQQESMTLNCTEMTEDFIKVDDEKVCPEIQEQESMPSTCPDSSGFNAEDIPSLESDDISNVPGRCGDDGPRSNADEPLQVDNGYPSNGAP